MPGVGRGQGQRKNGGSGGGNQWRNSNTSFNQSNKAPAPQPLMQAQLTPAPARNPAQYPIFNQNQLQNQLNPNQQLLTLQQQQLMYMQQQQQFLQPSFQAQANAAGSALNSQLPVAQTQMLALQQQQMMGSAPTNTASLVNQQMQAINQQGLGHHNYQQGYSQQLQTNMQLQQQAIPNYGQLQQRQFMQHQQNYPPLPQQQQYPPQQQFTQQHQFPPQPQPGQPQPTAPNQQWISMWNQMGAGAGAANTTNIMNSPPAQSVKPPLPPTPAPPPPPVSIINPPLPPEPKPEKHDLGRIRSTNLPGLLDIIAGKSKANENKIPGLDIEPAPSPKDKSVEDIESDALNRNTEIQILETASGVYGGQLNSTVETKTDNPISTTCLPIVSEKYESGSSTSHTLSSTATASIPASSGEVSSANDLQNVISEGTNPDSISSVPAENSSANSTKEALLAFDKKFREWEKQFEDWKRSSSVHPDKAAYAQYLSQWEAMRDQLIQQRRFIIENLNKDRGPPPANTAGKSAQMVLKNWNDQPVSTSVVNVQTSTVTTSSNNQSSLSKKVPQAAVSNAQPTSVAPTNDLPKVMQPAPPTAQYETRDLSKLIQNPFAVTGGPISLEQRHFLHGQQQFQAKQPQIMRDTFSAFTGKEQPLVGPNPFDVGVKNPASSSKIPSLLETSISRPKSPVERVSREPRSTTAITTIDLNDDEEEFQRYDPLLETNSFSAGDIPVKSSNNTKQIDREELLRDTTRNQMSSHHFQSSSNYESTLASFQKSSAEGSNDELDRRTDLGFSDDFQFSRRELHETSTSAPVTFDYGHGSNPITDESLFSRNRGAFGPSDSGGTVVTNANESVPVTFDYGHGTASPVPLTVGTALDKDLIVEEDVDNYHDRYQDPMDEVQPEQDYYGRSGPPPFYPDQDFRGYEYSGGPPGPGMFRGRGMPPMRGYRPPHPGPNPGMYYDEYGNALGPYRPRFPPPFHGPGPRFYGPGPPERFYPDGPGPRSSRPLFPITEFERPHRFPASIESGDAASRELDFRQAPPRDLEPISPEGSPRGSTSSRDRDRSRGRSGGRNRGRSSSRERDRSSDRLRRHSDRSSREREREVSPFSRKRRETSPRPRDKRGRSRSRSPARRDRDRRSSPDRSFGGGRRSSPNTSSSSRPVLIEDILNVPGRNKRPSQIVIILRGLPGSGKTHVAKLIKDRETEFGESAPRILSLDDYFMTGEEKKTVKDPLTGKQTKESVPTYEYDVALETEYRNDLFKTFRKTIEAGYFRFIIVDCVNDRFRHFQEMTNFAKAKRFQVYVVEMEGKAEDCAKKNIHNRSLAEIKDIEKNWERTPSHFTKLDVRNLLQDAAVHHVEMEDVSDSEDLLEGGAQPVEIIEIEDESGPWATSKWETSEDKLNKLDGLGRRPKNADSDDEKEEHQSLEQWLRTHVPEDYSYRRDTQPGKKRVRWADIEARREQDRAREIGFVVGHTDWTQMSKDASSALTRTKYI